MNVKIKIDKDKGLKALVFSDLHIYYNRDIVAVQKFLLKFKENYDAIFVVGDIIDSCYVLENEKNFDDLTRLFKHFGELAPTYVVSGNHDVEVRMRRKSNCQSDYKLSVKFFDVLSKLENVYYLNNETVRLSNGYTISGIVASQDYVSARNVLQEKCALRNIGEYDFIKKLKPEDVNIVLCHFPNLIMHLEERNILQHVDVSIAGHNHNGCTQFRFFPIEKIMDSLGQSNRGIITPWKSMKLRDTFKLRGVIHFDRNTLVINPAYKTLSKCSGILSHFNWMFYKGYTVIEFLPKE